MFRIFDLGYYFCGRLEYTEGHGLIQSFKTSFQKARMSPFSNKCFGLFFLVDVKLVWNHSRYLKRLNESRIFDRINRLGQHLNGKHRIGKSECNVSQVTTLDHRSMKKDTLSAVGRTDAVSRNETAKNK